MGRLIASLICCAALLPACASSDQPTGAEREDETSSTEVPQSTTQPTAAPEADLDQKSTNDSTTSSIDPAQLVVSHPIADLDAMWASQPYATQDNEIGIQFHNGVDYFVTEPEVTVLSAVSGILKEARVVERQPDGAFQVNLMIVADGGEVVAYSLEPSAGPADSEKIAEQAVFSQQMFDAMMVQPGDRIEIGQPIGVLLAQDEWAHVHMTVKQSNGGPEVWLCPMDFMVAEERDELLEPTQAWADRLYNGSKSPSLCND